jgi:hypothetical protein
VEKKATSPREISRQLQNFCIVFDALHSRRVISALESCRAIDERNCGEIVGNVLAFFASWLTLFKNN